VRLLNTSGAAVTGVVPADITNGVTPTHVSVVKADGTLTDITLSNGGNFFEIDATKAPGLYHIEIPSGGTSVPGLLQLQVMPTAATFVATCITGQVETIALDAEIARKIMGNKLSIDDVTKQMTIYEDDGVTAAYVFNLYDKDNVASTVNPYTREPVP
jgi:hypothetical protein